MKQGTSQPKLYSSRSSPWGGHDSLCNNTCRQRRGSERQLPLSEERVLSIESKQSVKGSEVHSPLLLAASIVMRLAFSGTEPEYGLEPSKRPMYPSPASTTRKDSALALLQMRVEAAQAFPVECLSATTIPGRRALLGLGTSGLFRMPSPSSARPRFKCIGKN